MSGSEACPGYVMEDLDGGIPEHLRTFYVGRESGDVYVPAFEDVHFLCATMDGKFCIINDGQAYIPLEWAAEEFGDHYASIDPERLRNLARKMDGAE